MTKRSGHLPDGTGDLDNMDPEQMDARIYQDLQARLANGEQLDGNALKFMEQYKAAHPEQTTGEKTVTDETVKREPQNGGKAARLPALKITEIFS